MKTIVVPVVYSVAAGGRFSVSKTDIVALLQSKEGLHWDLALDDGGNDPHYCRGQLKITQFDEKTGSMEGTIVYNNKPRKFSGSTEHSSQGRIRYSFTFTEPAAPMS